MSMRKTLIPLAAAALLVAACAPVDNTADPNLPSPSGSTSPAAAAKTAKPKTTRTVTYKIAGSASKALITYSTPSGQEQKNGAAVPWHKSFKVKKDAFDVLTVSAQNGGGGTISCEILIDGKTVKRSNSSGQFAVVSCDHTLGF